MLSKYSSNSNTHRAPTYSKLILWKCAVICTPVSHTLQTSVSSFTPLVYLSCVELLCLRSTYDAYFSLKYLATEACLCGSTEFYIYHHVYIYIYIFFLKILGTVIKFDQCRSNKIC